MHVDKDSAGFKLPERNPESLAMARIAKAISESEQELKHPIHLINVFHGEGGTVKRVDLITLNQDPT